MNKPESKTFPCEQCGGELEYTPGENSMKCLFCGTVNEIAESAETINEQDFLSALNNAEESAELEERITITCASCAAQVSFEDNKTYGECSYCGSNIDAIEHSVKQIKPKAILPFDINDKDAKLHFDKWLKSRWFMPNKVKNQAKLNKLVGNYCPFWTYDSDTICNYTGSRGDYYYVTESYSTTVNGKSVTRTRRVRKTRWSSARGIVYDKFDDILILASKNLLRKYAEKLEPWDLSNLVPYSEKYISGLGVESYSINLEDGFKDAQTKMSPVISNSVKMDIGGDEQRINNMNIDYKEIKFKHILLPIWMSAYKYNKQVYRFMINGRTGEVQGERPWSWVKITFTIILALLIIGLGILTYNHYYNPDAISISNIFE